MKSTSELVFTSAPIPEPKKTDNTKRERNAKYRRTDKGRAMRNRSDRKMTVTKYDARQIVAWDGEGITKADGKHYYTLLSCMAEDEGIYRYIRNDNGLTWAQIKHFLLQQQKRFPKHLHVIYGGNYDFNMIIHEMSLPAATNLYQKGHVRFGDSIVRWRPGRLFGIKIKGTDYSLTIHDVVSFFQQPFVKACDEYLGDDWLERAMIIAEKQKRGNFTILDNLEVEKYNKAELINLIRLVRELRVRLARVGLRPIAFDGPGSIAGALMRREGTKAAQNACPEPVASAARYAYAGGRFEPVRFGWFRAAHEYDIRSAYPSGMRDVPNLKRGKWVHHEPDEQLALSDFTLVRLHTTALNHSIPGPMFCRHKDGTVSFPVECENWVWGPEYGAIYEWANNGLGKAEILEIWEYVPDNYNDKPFYFINDIYKERAYLKSIGDGAQLALKLAINSLYGKCAQQLGAFFDGQNWRIPSYHQLEWAGYITSSCRAKMLRATLQNPEAVIAFETDAIFTSEPLDLPISSELGDFEHKEFDELIYVQSGVYASLKIPFLWEIKSRGIDRGYLTLEMLEKGLTENEKIPAPLTRFVMIGSALRNGIEHWTEWNTLTKHLNPGPSGKRLHDDFDCETCKDVSGKGFAKGPHKTYCPHVGFNASKEFPIAWINPNPDMKELDDLRHEFNDFE